MIHPPKRYLVTAALPYANGPLHIGHLTGAYLPADIYVRMLRMLGNEVEVATDGVSGLQAAETHRPEVVLLDIGLPEMNGYDVARRIREQPWGGQMALVALTGWGQDEDRRLAREAGFDHHLVKPVDPAELEAIIGDS